jgi:hypothetical protein
MKILTEIKVLWHPSYTYFLSLFAVPTTAHYKIESDPLQIRFSSCLYLEQTIRISYIVYEIIFTLSTRVRISYIAY